MFWKKRQKSENRDESRPEEKARVPGSGFGSSFRVVFTNDDRGTWTEEGDVVGILNEELGAAGHSFRRIGETLVDEAFGLILSPELESFQPRDDGGSITATILEVKGPETLAGIFEFQHGVGESIRESLGSGFRSWIEGDLPVFRDAMSEIPEVCTVLKLGSIDSGLNRRAILGPVTAYPACEPDEHGIGCPCCLLTNCFEAFADYIHGEGVTAIRLFASRSNEGKAMVDCRLNGLDYEAGMEALRNYVKTWPGRGFAFGKQYVLLQGAPEC